MSRAIRWIFRHAVLCIALGVAAPSALPARTSAPPEVDPDRPHLAEIEGALDALAAGKLKKARALLDRAGRDGGGELAGLVRDLLDAYLGPRPEEPLLKAEAQAWRIPKDDYRVVLPWVRAALQGSTRPEPRGQLRGLLCHLRLLGGVEGPPQAGGVRTVHGDLGVPRRTFSVEPEHTPAARRAKVQGVVIVQAVVDREGCVTETKVTKGLPHGLDAAAQSALRWWVFEPATLEGEPVSAYYNTTVSFRLR